MVFEKVKKEMKGACKYSVKCIKQTLLDQDRLSSLNSQKSNNVISSSGTGLWGKAQPLKSRDQEYLVNDAREAIFEERAIKRVSTPCQVC